jgi:hypothetical protein
MMGLGLLQLARVVFAGWLLWLAWLPPSRHASFMATLRAMEGRAAASALGSEMRRRADDVRWLSQTWFGRRPVAVVRLSMMMALAILANHAVDDFATAGALFRLMASLGMTHGANEILRAYAWLTLFGVWFVPTPWRSRALMTAEAVVLVSLAVMEPSALVWVPVLVMSALFNSVGFQLVLHRFERFAAPGSRLRDGLAVVLAPVGVCAAVWLLVFAIALGWAVISGSSIATAAMMVWPWALVILIGAMPAAAVGAIAGVLPLLAVFHWMYWRVTAGVLATFEEYGLLRHKRKLAGLAVLVLSSVWPATSARVEAILRVFMA